MADSQEPAIWFHNVHAASQAIACHAPRLLGDDDLTILIIAAVGADVMGKLDGAAARADGAGGGVNLHVGGTTRVSGSAALFLLRYWHDDLP